MSAVRTVMTLIIDSTFSNNHATTIGNDDVICMTQAVLSSTCNLSDNLTNTGGTIVAFESTLSVASC